MRTQRGETIILETCLFECACMLFARVRCVELRILDAARLCRETEESNARAPTRFITVCYSFIDGMRARCASNCYELL